MNANFAIQFTFSMTWHEWISDFMWSPKLQVEGAGLWRSGAGTSCCSACTIYSRENEKSKDREPETDGPSPHAVLTNNKRCSSTSSPLHFLPPAGVKEPLTPSAPPRGPARTIRKCEAQVKSCGQIRGFKSPNWVFMSQRGVVNPSSLGLHSSFFPWICLHVKWVFSGVCSVKHHSYYCSYLGLRFQALIQRIKLCLCNSSNAICVAVIK